VKALSEHTKAALLSVAVGILAGNVCAAFLFGLSYVTEIRLARPEFLLASPLIGLAVGLLTHFAGRGDELSVNAVLEGLHEPSKVVSLRTGGVVFVASLLSHLAGASVGREGVGVLLGGVCASAVARVLRVSREATRILLLAGISAGFTGTFGTPLAGLVFALEVASFGRVSYDGLLAVTVAAVASLLTTHLWPIQHASFPVGDIPALGALSASHALFAGLLFGLAGLLFLWCLRASENFARRLLPWPWTRPAVAGAVIAGLFLLTRSQTFFGLGLSTLEESFNTPLPWWLSFLKSGLTAFSLGFGFKGGEVTPLFFVGSTLGNALDGILLLPYPLLAAMGLVSVLAGVTNTPLAGVLLGMELFGAEAGIYCAIACVGSYLIVGHRGLYSAQKVGAAKSAGLRPEEGERIGALRNL
jgi:H+/Cl- antiporter ClcA